MPIRSRANAARVAAAQGDRRLERERSRPVYTRTRRRERQRQGFGIRNVSLTIALPLKP